MCYVASLAVTYIGLGIHQLHTEESSECVIVGIRFKSKQLDCT